MCVLCTLDRNHSLYFKTFSVRIFFTTKFTKIYIMPLIIAPNSLNQYIQFHLHKRVHNFGTPLFKENKHNNLYKKKLVPE